MKIADLNWIAGIMDKGCAITAARNRKRFCIRVVMSSTNAEVAMRLHKLIGTGNIKIHQRKWIIKHHKTRGGRAGRVKEVYRYMLCGVNARDFLETITQFLRTERSQRRAALAIQLHEDHSRTTLRKLKRLGTRTH